MDNAPPNLYGVKRAWKGVLFRKVGVVRCIFVNCVVLQIVYLRMLNLGDEFPNFKAVTTTGLIQFHEWIGDS